LEIAAITILLAWLICGGSQSVATRLSTTPTLTGAVTDGSFIGGVTSNTAFGPKNPQ